ncbi:toll/interleukin-1 receptor domain-containing protein [Modestobacter sp. L9-4]|uniref:toll/interleukin-1 receptor domain-containing protein n=1 Tax=Modestobacter sp. L9-4 TaxID=2851567 RepID=UPI001C740308|nr:toll/interleukin-1 receptor domain-containing protein [Modestobacter sp. L9-4]QXG75540.1 toll/interleukin-1 receptor domain-containing protein [Modestobacter sp. L9-4]
MTQADPQAGLSALGRVFLSYSRVDQDVAYRLVEVLRIRGASVFSDSSIRPGDEWQSELVNGIESADVVVALVSRKSLDSDWQRVELSLALERAYSDASFHLLPVLLDDVDPPYSLSSIQYLRVSQGVGPDVAAVEVADALQRMGRQMVRQMPNWPEVPGSLGAEWVRERERTLIEESRLRRRLGAYLAGVSALFLAVLVCSLLVVPLDSSFLQALVTGLSGVLGLVVGSYGTHRTRRLVEKGYDEEGEGR